MSARSERLGKLLAIEASRVSAAERAVFEARAALAAAEENEARASADVLASLDQWNEVTSAGDLEQAAHRRSWLRAVVKRANAAVRTASAAVTARDKELVAVRIAARKVEILIESIAKTEKARATVAERRRDDEQAARWAR